MIIETLAVLAVKKIVIAAVGKAAITAKAVAATKAATAAVTFGAHASDIADAIDTVSGVIDSTDSVISGDRDFLINTMEEYMTEGNRYAAEEIARKSGLPLPW